MDTNHIYANKMLKVGVRSMTDSVVDSYKASTGMAKMKLENAVATG